MTDPKEKLFEEEIENPEDDDGIDWDFYYEIGHYPCGCCMCCGCDCWMYEEEDEDE